MVDLLVLPRFSFHSLFRSKLNTQWTTCKEQLNQNLMCEFGWDGLVSKNVDLVRMALSIAGKLLYPDVVIVRSHIHEHRVHGFDHDCWPSDVVDRRR